MEESEVLFYKCVPGDAISTSGNPDWLKANIENGLIRLFTANAVDESGWLQLKVFTGQDWEVCDPEMFIGVNKSGKLYVRKAVA